MEVEQERAILPTGRGEVVKEGTDIAVLAVGRCVPVACEAARTVEEKYGCSIRVFDPVWLKPLPEEQILDIMKNFRFILSVEEGAVQGGFGSSLLEFACDEGLLGSFELCRIGVPDMFIEHATQAEQRHDLFLDVEGIAEKLGQLAQKAGFSARSEE